MNLHILTGNIGQDARINDVNGNKSINFSIARNDKYTNKETGVVTEKTTWVNCTYWRRNGQSTDVAEFLKKGTKVLVHGEPNAHMYQDKEGRTQLSHDLNVQYLELLGSKPQTEAAAAEPAAAKADAFKA